MSATVNASLERCSLCKQMTAPIYIARRTLFSRTCRMCKNREESELELKRKAGTGPRGLLGWILPGLILGAASLWYFKVEVPGADKVKAFVARIFSSKPEEGNGSRLGPEKEQRAGNTSQPAAEPAGDSASRTLTLNLRSDVLFEFGNHALKPAAAGTLRDAAKVIQQRPGASVVIRGYTDSIGTEQANLALSRQRAESVRDWMIKNGVSAKHLSVLGMGAKDPIAPNAKTDGSDNPAGREQNRRVTVTVTGS